MAHLIKHMKSLQIVACLIVGRGDELRKTALICLAMSYKILGDVIWRYVGKVTEAQRSMQDDRFKWKAYYILVYNTLSCVLSITVTLLCFYCFLDALRVEKRKEGKRGELRDSVVPLVRENG